MESFDLFIKQRVPPANKRHENFVLSGRRHLGYHGYHTSSVMLEQLKGCYQPLLRGEEGGQVNADLAVLCDSHCHVLM